MNHELVVFLWNNTPLLLTKLLQHIKLSVSATGLAILVGVPLGVIITHYPRLKNSVLNITSSFQTIPSLALLAFLIPFIGIGIKPTLITLTVYALLPITRNTFTGIQNIPAENIEAAKGLGFTTWQRLRLIEIPLAMPTIIAGIRTATAMTVGITTIAAFIGAGGLGDFITQGLALDNPRLILLGAIPTALLALALDFFIAHIEIALSPRKHLTLKLKKIKWSLFVLIMIVLLTLMGRTLIQPFITKKQHTITIATKNFTEQYILGHIIADLIKTKTELNVIEKFNLGTTSIVQNALIKGDVDLYPEYTGTAYLVILKHKKIRNAAETFSIVKNEYRRRFDLLWLSPFGFENSETLAVKQDFATQHHLATLNDLTPLAPKLRLAAPPEFLKRPDGLPGLSHLYQLHFKTIQQMQADLMYQAIENHDVDVINAFTTDARIAQYNLKLLTDDRHFYPPYYAATVIRASTLKKYPEIANALAPLAGLINNKTMQHLNYLVDVKQQTPRHVAHDFLVKQGLIRR